MELRNQVVSTILFMEGFFTIDDVYQKLKEKGISLNTNVLSLIEDIFELPSIRNVPFSNKYYILN